MTDFLIVEERNQSIGAAVWNAPASTYNAINTMAKLIQELYKLQGLDIIQPMTVTQTQRVVDDINLALGQNINIEVTI